MSYDWISFTSDFGHDDGFVAACVGVIARITPAARIVHVTHTVAPREIRHGAIVLAQTAPYLPPAVHLAVVDPGVGTTRRPVVIEAADGLLVGPDNGLLVPAAEALGGIRSVHELTSAEYQLPTVSTTFHGRDLFAPAAAHLAAGVPVEQFGPPIDPAALVRLPESKVVVEHGKLTTEVLSVDRYGNLQLAGRDLDILGSAVRVGGRKAIVGRTFADASHGALVVYLDSAGYVAIAVNGGSAAAELAHGAGDTITLTAIR